MSGVLRWVALCGLLLGSWSLVAAETVRGSGHVVSETRALAGYQALSLRGPFKVELRQGGREGVELRGDDNVLPLVETAVVDGRHGKTLDIGYRSDVSVSTRNELVVLVHFTSLRAVALKGSGDIAGNALKFGPLDLVLSGSGNVHFKDLAADRLDASVSGSGDIDASGRAGQCAISIAGSGDIGAGQLACEEMTVRIAGSGDAQVQARKTLTVSISGSGDVTYVGDPQVTSSIAGSGSVRRR